MLSRLRTRIREGRLIKRYHRPLVLHPAVALVLAVVVGVGILVVTEVHPLAQTSQKPPTFVTKWGQGGTENGNFYNPSSIATDSKGNIYVTDTYNYRIQKFDSNGKYDRQWGESGDEDGQFVTPLSIAIDSKDNVYVADTENNRIQKFDSNGKFLTKWGRNGDGQGEFQYPSGVAIDSKDNVYVADTENNRIQKFDSNGKYDRQWGGVGYPSDYDDANGRFNNPSGIATDSKDNVYVADSSNHRIQKFDSNGKFLTKWGRNGDDNGNFNTPRGVATDSKDNVYVVEETNNRVQRFDSNGKVLTKWGEAGLASSGASADGKFNLPLGIATDSKDNVYIADTANNRIQKFGQNLARVRVEQNDVPDIHGVAAKLTIHTPYVNRNSADLSLAEVALGNPQATSTQPTALIELGWMVNPGYYKDTNPHLFLGVRQNGQFGDKISEPNFCWIHKEGDCGFRLVSDPQYKPDANLAALADTNEPQTFHIGYYPDDNSWWIQFQNDWIGHIDANWFRSSGQGPVFTRAQAAYWYGEVESDKEGLPCAEMGNGSFGTRDSSGRAQFVDMSYEKMDESETVGNKSKLYYRQSAEPTSDYPELWNGKELAPASFGYGGPGNC